MSRVQVAGELFFVLRKTVNSENGLSLYKQGTVYSLDLSRIVSPSDLGTQPSEKMHLSRSYQWALSALSREAGWERFPVKTGHG